MNGNKLESYEVRSRFFFKLGAIILSRQHEKNSTNKITPTYTPQKN